MQKAPKWEKFWPIHACMYSMHGEWTLSVNIRSWDKMHLINVVQFLSLNWHAIHHRIFREQVFISKGSLDSKIHQRKIIIVIKHCDYLWFPSSKFILYLLPEICHQFFFLIIAALASPLNKSQRVTLRNTLHDQVCLAFYYWLFLFCLGFTVVSAVYACLQKSGNHAVRAGK